MKTPADFIKQPVYLIWYSMDKKCRFFIQVDWDFAGCIGLPLGAGKSIEKNTSYSLLGGYCLLYVSPIRRKTVRQVSYEYFRVSSPKYEK